MESLGGGERGRAGPQHGGAGRERYRSHVDDGGYPVAMVTPGCPWKNVCVYSVPEVAVKLPCAHVPRYRVNLVGIGRARGLGAEPFVIPAVGLPEFLCTFRARDPLPRKRR